MKSSKRVILSPYRLLPILLALFLLTACNSTMKIREYEEKGISNLSNFELLEYRRNLIAEISRINRELGYQEIDSRINASLANTYAKHGFNNAAAQSGVDLIGNIVTSAIESSRLEGLHESLYSVTAELKRRGWDGSYGFSPIVVEDGAPIEVSPSRGQQIRDSYGFQRAYVPEPEIKKPKDVGESSHIVESLAGEHGCNPDGTAQLLSDEYGTEIYKMKCTNADSLVFVCVYRNCSQMR